MCKKIQNDKFCDDGISVCKFVKEKKDYYCFQKQTKGKYNLWVGRYSVVTGSFEKWLIWPQLRLKSLLCRDM